jgi:hypothetical protein
VGMNAEDAQRDVGPDGSSSLSAADLFYDDSVPLEEKRRRLTEMADAGDTNARGYLGSLLRIERIRRREDA